MENSSLASAALSDSLSESCRSTDEKLLNRYSAQLIADDVPWRERSWMLTTTTQFLRWWRKHYVGQGYEICATAGSRPSHESEWSNLREIYLREACPNHALRPEERACLNRFLHFIIESPQLAPCPPVLH
jgi:hypothetical protein